eukprot:6468253-Amphidinium_carterae.1
MSILRAGKLPSLGGSPGGQPGAWRCQPWCASGCPQRMSGGARSHRQSKAARAFSFSWATGLHRT